MAWKNNITIKANTPETTMDLTKFPTKYIQPLQTEGAMRHPEKAQEGQKESGLNLQSTPSGKGGVKEIIIMKKTIIHIYPDGQTHIQKHLCQEWIAGMGQVYKQKAKAKQEKKKDLDEIKIVEGESY